MHEWLCALLSDGLGFLINVCSSDVLHDDWPLGQSRQEKTPKDLFTVGVRVTLTVFPICNVRCHNSTESFLCNKKTDGLELEPHN